MGYVVADFVADVAKILQEKGEGTEAIWACGPLLQRLVHEGGDLTQQGESRVGSSGLESRVLHEDSKNRFRLVVARFAAGEPTPVHSHFRWGLECGISGKERFTVWTRVDEGIAPGHSHLQVHSDHHIERGDLAYWYDAPRNVHRQWAEGDQPSCVVILTGSDGKRQHIFDLDKGTHTDTDA